MADRDPNRAVTTSKNDLSSSGVIDTWRKEVEAKAKVRRMKIENELGQQLVIYHDRQADLEDSKGRLAAARARNSDMDSIKMNAALQVQAELGDTEARLQAQDVQRKKLDAEADQIITTHQANMAQEEGRRLQAEASALDAQIAIEEKKRKLAQMQGDTTKLKAEYEATRAAKQAELETWLEEEEELLDPKYDDDENLGLKKRKVEQEITRLKSEIALLDKQIETLS